MLKVRDDRPLGGIQLDILRHLTIQTLPEPACWAGIAGVSQVRKHLVNFISS